MAALALEISLLRFFSVTQWYHFAFMVVSIALFGIGAAGSCLYIRKVRNIAHLPLFFSISALIAFFITNTITFDPYKAMLNYSHLFHLLVYYVLLGAPFFFFGLIMAASFQKYQKDAGKLYASNLIGSALGCIVVLPLLFFGPKAIIIISLIGVSAAWFFTRKNKRPVALVFIAITALLIVPFEPAISAYKELSLSLNIPNAEHLGAYYNSFSRVDLVRSSFAKYAPGLSPSFRGELPEQIGVMVDGSGMNAITRQGQNLEFLDFLPSSVGFAITEKPKTLVINAGAGLDVLAALQSNASVTAVESNLIIVSLLRSAYKNFSGDIYGKADVRIAEGRSIVKNSIKNNEKYDMVVLSLAGNVLSSSAGLTSIAENYLLTADAIKDYYNILSDDGVLVITRWLLYPPRESLRLFSLAMTIEGAEKNTAMFRSWTTVTLVLSKKELSDDYIKSIKGFTEKNRFDMIYLPADFTPNVYGRFKKPYYYNGIQKILMDRERFYRAYLFDVSPVHDDRPFFFNFFKPARIRHLYTAMGEKWQPLLDSGFLLYFILLQAIVLSAVFIILPLFFYKQKKKPCSVFNPLAYFFCIGIAYLFIEIVFIQKFIMFLEQTIYAVSTVIFSMLLFSGIGSYVSSRIREATLIRIGLRRAIIFIFVLVLIYSLLLPLFISHFMTFSLVVKLFLAVTVIAPLAFFMGFPFPLGMRIIKKELMPWAWAVNGSASVLSTIIAVIIALYTGYSLVMFVAGVIYIMGLFFIRKCRA